jgi:hypothetical protein
MAQTITAVGRARRDAGYQPWTKLEIAGMTEVGYDLSIISTL